MDPRADLVGRGYDVISERFAEWRDGIVGDPRREGRRSLSRGCTTVRECSNSVAVLEFPRRSASRSVSESPVWTYPRSRCAVPEVRCQRRSSCRPTSPPLIWSPSRGTQLSRSMRSTGDIEAWTGDFLGASTFFSSFPPATNTRLVREAGFEIVRDQANPADAGLLQSAGIRAPALGRRLQRSQHFRARHEWCLQAAGR